MPIYMDRHNIPAEVTSEHVARMHLEDLKVQHLYGCKGMTYWCDDKNGTAFCLIEAPNKEALKKMHDHAHGALPHAIIEVDPMVVEAFLGRIKDPDFNGQPGDLNVISESAHRIIMVSGFEYEGFLEDPSFTIALQEYFKDLIVRFEGSIVKLNKTCGLVSFKSVTNAVMCAIDIQAKFKKYISEHKNTNLKLNIGLCTGVPFNEKGGVFDETVKFAEWMCNFVSGQIVMSSEVRNLFESESLNVFIADEQAHTLSPSEEKFLSILMEHTEKTWNDTSLTVESFSKSLGFSKSQLYRKMQRLTNKSLNSFIKDYRLKKACEYLEKKKGNISEIAFETGFNSPAYFTKCFQEAYGILPSAYNK
ncbi:nickel-binding protein [Mangrovimonas sp. TPBH4]|uniref:nickel-binding protein n=1 Tax=Mangrovimonas sp. TPBH4 TaxID=1645914 RepID=UPI0006B59AA5|nr:nickel-binding protein [Mangrovimonas sp. TPBH4]